jgi:large subunit ribosomal protein L27
MAHRKAGGTAKNLRDSKPKYLGTKLYAGETAKTGDVLVRQRGTPIVAGPGVKMGKDHTLFAGRPGIVNFKNVRKVGFNGKPKVLKMVSVN